MVRLIQHPNGMLYEDDNYQLFKVVSATVDRHNHQILIHLINGRRVYLDDTVQIHMEDTYAGSGTVLNSIHQIPSSAISCTLPNRPVPIPSKTRAEQCTLMESEQDENNNSN